ncbi:DMT family transporter [Stenotrophomonas rhizophila]|uniref:DMT family transporter n=1 Tax=Stenotrophomonas rhizophila TaxID=216778 RepID=UPI001E48A851|nr:DMT family transporter [Stenotrophomonas rhizophila]MCC7635049.1 DMT family transporter [Stenotrophomonas rhizophila]MCC7662574.1 DMT family transporter [Stenotrophomonas rhizophila]
MPISDTRKALLQIHFCVLLWGVTAILGKLITLPALPLVWWRMLLVVAMLALLPRVWRGLRQLSPALFAGYCGVGALVALHWLTFYGAVKLANASVAATCIALAPVFTAVIEPWVAKRPFQLRELAFGIAVLPGVALVVGGVPHGMRLGVLIGALSALLVAVFGSLNKRLVSHADPLTVTALELGAGTVTLTLLAPALPFLLPALASPLWVVPSLHDGLLLLGLAGVCTLLPFALALVALRHLSAYTVQLVTNLEPVYAIVLAMILLSEQRELTPLFYAGVAIIIGAVFLHPLMNRRTPVEHAEILATAEARNIVD